MKILAVSDKVMDVIYTPNIGQNFGSVDLVLACGDLPFYYLDFILSSLNVPACFVYGNHDLDATRCADGRVVQDPPGWVNLDNQTIYEQGLLLAGLEGSIRYRPDGVHQYSQNEMTWKALRLAFHLLRNRLRYGRYLDILIAHSPAFGIHDGPDWPHIGFKAFLWLMDWFKPRYLLHGHKHVYGPQATETVYNETTVINVYPYKIVPVEAQQA